MDAVSLHASDRLVNLAGVYAFEGDVAVFDDDVNRRNSAQLVLGEGFVAVDGAVSGAADLIVVNGGGQDLDIVAALLDGFNVFDGVFCVGLEGGTRDLSEQGHGAIGVDLVGEVIKHAVKRKHHEFMTNFLDDPIDALLTDRASWLVVVGGGTGWGPHQENQWQPTNVDDT